MTNTAPVDVDASLLTPAAASSAGRRYPARRQPPLDVTAALDAAAARDTELLDLVRAGDKTAFGKLYRAYRSYAYAIGRRVDPTGEIDDVVSIAFERILSAIRNGGGPTTGFRAYLATTVKRAAIELAIIRSNRATLQLEEEAPWADDKASDPLLGLAIRETISALNNRYRVALEITILNDGEVQDVADELEISYGAAAILVMRARNRFKELWQRDHPHDPRDRGDAAADGEVG